MTILLRHATQKPPAGPLRLDISHPLAQGLAGYWPFNEVGSLSVNDGAGFNLGTLTGGVTWVSTARGPVLDFNGTSGSYLPLSSQNNLKPTTAISFGAWCYLTGSSGVALAIGCGGAFVGGYALYFDNVSVGFACQVGGTSETSHGLGNFTANVWTFLVCTWDGAQIRAYQDGRLLGTSTAFAGPISYTDNVVIGGKAASNPFFGRIDAPFVYNRALSLPEIQSLMAEPYAMFQTRPLQKWWSLFAPGGAPPPATTPVSTLAMMGAG